MAATAGAAPAAPACRTTGGSGPRAAHRGRAGPSAEDDSIDLGATVLPVLVRSYAPYVVVGVVGVVLGWLIGRR